MKKILLMVILAGVFLFSGVINAAEQVQESVKSVAPMRYEPCGYCKTAIKAHIGAIKQAKDCNTVESIFDTACEAEFRQLPFGIAPCVGGGIYLRKQCDNMTFPVFMKQLENDLESNAATICYYGYMCKK